MPLVIDLDSGHVIWVGPGKGGVADNGFWLKLRADKAKIVAAACDMSAAYWTVVLKSLSLHESTFKLSGV